ncbi:MAG: carotenoid 1,2-hydratase [Chloroflexi bacterium]|nr:carotenoid 1,2-hydratase [Chloroflexota bacterium]
MRVTSTLFIALLVLAAALAALTQFLFRLPTPDPFAQASAAFPPQLPRDAGAHAAFASEWWYYTGLLEGPGGQRYGFQLVFFKAYPPEHARLFGRLPVSWLCNPAYTAHLAVTDLQHGAFYPEERSNCPWLWTGGARTDHLAVWNGSWRVETEGADHLLQAETDTLALSLRLTPQKPAVFHGGQGVVEMGEGGASNYISFTALSGSGTLTWGGQPLPVQASAWADHQWGSWDWERFRGWDWFSLRLDSGQELMLFQFRNADGTPQAASWGTFVDVDGSATPLPEASFRVEPLGSWQSPHTGASYPAGWRIVTTLPPGEVWVEPLVADQEMVARLGPSYWEGIVGVRGELGAAPVEGVAYVELTGYR